MLEANPVSTAQHAKAYRVLSWIHILLGDGVSVDQALHAAGVSRAAW